MSDASAGASVSPEEETFLPSRDVQDSAAEFASTEAEREDLIGSLRDRYRLTRVLGKGGFGVVYLAHDRVLDQDVAIKVLKLGVANDTYRKRFIFEARTAAKLRHSAIVNVFDIRQTESGLQLVMEYYAGGTVDDLIRKESKIEPKDALKMIRQVAQGLAYAHRQGIIHRDIKPGNMFLASDGTVKLGDFGICANYDTHDHTMTGEVMGTPIYMAPEQHRDSKDVDPRSDIYALGMTLFHMVTGRPPRVVNLEIVPPQLRSIVSRTTAYDRRDRPASAQQLIALIDKTLREWDQTGAGLPGPKESTLGSPPGPDSVGLSEHEPPEMEGLETQTAYIRPGASSSAAAGGAAAVGEAAAEIDTGGGGLDAGGGAAAAAAAAGAEPNAVAARRNSAFLLAGMGVLAVILAMGIVFALLPEIGREETRAAAGRIGVGAAEPAGDGAVAPPAAQEPPEEAGAGGGPDGAANAGGAGEPAEVAPAEPAGPAASGETTGAAGQIRAPDESGAAEQPGAAPGAGDEAEPEEAPEQTVAAATPNPLLAPPRPEEFAEENYRPATIEEYLAEGGRRDALDATRGALQSLDLWIPQADLPTGGMLLDAAQLKLGRAAESFPEDPVFPYLRGRVFEFTGEGQRARAQYERVARIDPEFLSRPVLEMQERLTLTGYQPKNEALAEFLQTPPSPGLAPAAAQ